MVCDGELSLQFLVTMVDPSLEVNGMTIVEDVPKTLKLMGSVVRRERGRGGEGEGGREELEMYLLFLL